jgi:hypothetical protein
MSECGLAHHAMRLIWGNGLAVSFMPEHHEFVSGLADKMCQNTTIFLSRPDLYANYTRIKGL